MDQIRRTSDERFVVTEIRYFVGPEDMQVRQEIRQRAYRGRRVRWGCLGHG